MSRAVRSAGEVLKWTGGPRLSILIFHRVLPRRDPLMPGEPDAAGFEARMRWLASAFRVLPLLEASRRLADGTLPANAASITFDDGYADNAVVAAPILAKLRLSATFFIATGFLDGGRMWNDTVIESVRRHAGPTLDLDELGLGRWPTTDDRARTAAIDGLLAKLKYLPQGERQEKVDAIARTTGLPPTSDLMMTSDQVRALRRYGMSVGGHTVTHPILTALSPEEARNEIVDGRRRLEEIVGERVRLFAYPNGKPLVDYDASHVAMVRDEGFDAAVSTAWGVSDRKTDRYQLRRFTPWDATPDRFGLRLARNLVRAGEAVAEVPRTRRAA